MDNDILQKIPVLTTKAGPRDKEWKQRLKEEYVAFIKLVELNQEDDNEWFQIEPNEEGTKWTGKCWHFHNYQKYEFKLQFEVIKLIK